MATTYYLDNKPFQNLVLADIPRPYYEYNGDQRGKQKGLAFPCVLPTCGHDRLSVKIEGIAEAGREFDRFGDDGVPPDTAIGFTNLRVKQFPQQGGFGLGLSATADDVSFVSSKSTAASPAVGDTGSNKK